MKYCIWWYFLEDLKKLFVILVEEFWSQFLRYPLTISWQRSRVSIGLSLYGTIDTIKSFCMDVSTGRGWERIHETWLAKQLTIEKILGFLFWLEICFLPYERELFFGGDIEKKWNCESNRSLFMKIIVLFHFQGKSVIRPIAFRPTPGASSGSSTPTNGYVVSSYRPNSANMANMQVPHFDYSGSPHIRASPATSSSHLMMGSGQQPPLPPLPPGHPSNNGEGFPPGHPLVKDGKRHYGSKKQFWYKFEPISSIFCFCKIFEIRTSCPSIKSKLSALSNSFGS